MMVVLCFVFRRCRADRCHLRLFVHPPRNRSAKLPEGFSPFVFDAEWKNHVPNYKDMNEKSEEERLAALIAEVERNGFGDDLTTRDGDSLLTGTRAQQQR